MIKRYMPPDEDSLVTLGPGEKAENSVVFRDPVVDVDRLRDIAGLSKRDDVNGLGSGNVVVQFRPDTEDDSGGVVVWPGRTRDELLNSNSGDLERLGNGNEEELSAVRWDVESEPFEMEIPLP